MKTTRMNARLSDLKPLLTEWLRHARLKSEVARFEKWTSEVLAYSGPRLANFYHAELLDFLKTNNPVDPQTLLPHAPPPFKSILLNLTRHGPRWLHRQNARLWAQALASHTTDQMHPAHYLWYMWRFGMGMSDYSSQTAAIRAQRFPDALQPYMAELETAQHRWERIVYWKRRYEEGLVFHKL